MIRALHHGLYSRFNRWRKAGVWDGRMYAIIAAYEARGETPQMIDSASFRVHQQAAAHKTEWRLMYRSLARRADDQAYDAPMA